MQPTMTAYPVNAISVKQALFSAWSQSRNPQAINMSKHHGALSWNSGLGKVMNEINYSTVGSRNSLELSTNTLWRFLEIIMELFRQAGRSWGTQAARCSSSSPHAWWWLGGNGYAARSSVALHTQTQRGCSRSRGAAVTRPHRANISQISLSLEVTPFSHQPSPPPPRSDPHTSRPRLDGWMDGWRMNGGRGGGSIFSPCTTAPLAHHNTNK